MKKSEKDIQSRVLKLLEKECGNIVDDYSIETEDKVAQMDVILNILKFLKNYEENVEILNKHNINKRWKREERGDE